MVRIALYAVHFTCFLDCTEKLFTQGAVRPCLRQRGLDCAFFVAVLERSRLGLARREEHRQKKGLAIMLVRATIASPPAHEECPHGICKRTRNVRLGQSLCPA